MCTLPAHIPGMHRRFFVSAVLVAAACGDDDRSTTVTIVYGDGTTGAFGVLRRSRCEPAGSGATSG